MRNMFVYDINKTKDFVTEVEVETFDGTFLKTTKGDWFSTDDCVFLTPKEYEIFDRKVKENNIDLFEVIDVFDKKVNNVRQLTFIYDYELEDDWIVITLK